MSKRKRSEIQETATTQSDFQTKRARTIGVAQNDTNAPRPRLRPYKNPLWPSIRERNRGKHWMKLDKILEKCEKPLEVLLPKELPTYLRIAAPVSQIPAKKYCDVTGFVAPYTDPKTKLHYCNAEVFHFIRNSLTSNEVTQYLELRKAHTVLK